MYKFTRWKFEVGKMFMYVFFPITMFAYFSNPARYEKDLIAIYKDHSLPVDEDDVKLLEEMKENVRRQKVEAFRAQLQESLKKN